MQDFTWAAKLIQERPIYNLRVRSGNRGMMIVVSLLWSQVPWHKCRRTIHICHWSQKSQSGSLLQHSSFLHTLLKYYTQTGNGCRSALTTSTQARTMACTGVRTISITDSGPPGYQQICFDSENSKYCSQDHHQFPSRVPKSSNGTIVFWLFFLKKTFPFCILYWILQSSTECCKGELKTALQLHQRSLGWEVTVRYNSLSFVRTLFYILQIFVAEAGWIAIQELWVYSVLGEYNYF